MAAAVAGIDREELWDRLEVAADEFVTSQSRGFRPGGLPHLRPVSPVELEKCPRCGTRLHLRKPASIQTTIALMAAASALYIPSHLLPVMTVVELGM
jgi:uncharacterized paraquat-inducible protein A